MQLEHMMDGVYHELGVRHNDAEVKVHGRVDTALQLIAAELHSSDIKQLIHQLS